MSGSIIYTYVGGNPLSYNDPTGLAVYLVGHVAAYPVGLVTTPTSYHMALLLVPDDPATLAGIKSYTLGGQPSDGNLVSAFNYPGDAPSKSKMLIQIKPQCGESDHDFIRNLIKAANSYKNNLKYSFPADLSGTMPSGTYNSNSYVAGVLQAAGVILPTLPSNEGWQAPGYNNPIPIPLK